MTQRRQSKRSSAITKRRLLEEKIQKRQEGADFRSLKSRSKAIRNLHSQELDAYSEEALRLVQIIERFYPSSPDSESSEDQSFRSLEWDDSGETSPTFLSERTHSDKAIDDLVDSINNLDN